MVGAPLLSPERGMHFKELVIQGLFGIGEGVRLPLTEGYCEPILPMPLDVGEFTWALSLVIYPRTVLERRPELVAESTEESVRLGARVETRSGDFKLLWDLRGESIQLYHMQEDDALELRAQGADQVEDFWREELALPDYDDWRALHFHDYDAVTTAAGLPDEIQKLIQEYRRSLTVEDLEEELLRLESELKRLEDQSSPTADLESRLARLGKRLNKFDKFPELSEEDRDFVAAFEKEQERIQSELDATTQALEDARSRLEASKPVHFLKSILFWIGLAIAVAAIIVANLRPEFRIAALGDILGFGLVAGVMLRYLNRRERSVEIQHQTRELERARTHHDKDLQKRKARIERFKRLSDVSTTYDLLEGIKEREALRQKRETVWAQLQEQLKETNDDARRQRIEELQAPIKALKSKRARFGELFAPSFEIAPRLEAAGVDPDALQPLDAPAERFLLDIGRRLDVLPEEGLRKGDLDALNRLAASLFGEDGGRFGFDDGHLTAIRRPGDDPRPLAELDERARLPWLRAIALTLVLQRHRVRVKEGENAAVLVLEDPWKGMQRDERIRYYTLLKEMARSFQVVIPKTDA